MQKATFYLERNNRMFPYTVYMNVTDSRIEFIRSPFDLKDEIKAMRGSRWHGFDKPPRKIWSVENHPRNVFQIRQLMFDPNGDGESPYSWFDQPLCETPDFRRPVREHQVDMVRRMLTYHFQIVAAEMRLGKSLALIETMERAAEAGATEWWYVSQASAVESVLAEIEKWELYPKVKLTVMSYDKLIQVMRYDFHGLQAPHGIAFDETDMVKNPTANRTIAAQGIADLIREQHGHSGYVFALSGSPSAKAPSDLWSQAEIVYPGFLREGSIHEFEKRYAIMEEGKDADGVAFLRKTGWKEDEVAELPNRLDGLMPVYRMADYLDLLPMQYEDIYIEPSNKVKRVAQSLCRVAPNTITALTWTRALSSGFQYVMKESGSKVCPVCNGTGVYSLPEESVCPGCGGTKEIAEYERETIKVECPKDDKLRELLAENEQYDRVIIAACFQGSVDRVVDLCHEEGWDTCIVDGRGWTVIGKDGKTITGEKVLSYWNNHKGRVAFVGNPGSARYGLALFAARMLIWYDLDFSAVYYIQMNARHQQVQVPQGQPPIQAKIVHLLHLPVDKLVLDTLQNNRKMELLSLGAISEMMDCEGCEEDSEEILQAIS